MEAATQGWNPAVHQLYSYGPTLNLGCLSLSLRPKTHEVTTSLEPLHDSPATLG